MLDVALEVEMSECIKSIATSLGFITKLLYSCSKFVGRLLLKSLPKCGNIRVKLRKFSTEDAKFVKLFPAIEMKRFNVMLKNTIAAENGLDLPVDLDM